MLKNLKRNLKRLRESEQTKVKTPGQVTTNKNQGISAHPWFYAAMQSYKPKGEPIAEKGEGITPPVTEQETAEQVLLQAPMISAATYLNLLKSKGFRIVKEALTSSAHVAMLKQRETSSVPTPGLQRQSGGFNLRSRLRESAASDNGIGFQRFQCVLIEEGLGNFRDAYFYSRSAIESAVTIFEGKKIYADHPSMTEENDRPERSVRDVIGHFENLKVIEGQGGQAQLAGDVVVLPDKPYEWARALMRHAVEYGKKFPDKEFVGLSINANGNAEPMEIGKVIASSPEGAKIKLQKAQAEGINEVKVVSEIIEAVSCDLVTQAGAGGRILAMLESDKEMKMEMKPGEEMKKEEMPKGEEKPEAPEAPKAPEAEEKKEEAAPEAPHDDEAADIALIKQMLDEYLGKGAWSEEDMKACGEAMKLAMKHGEAKESAAKLACSAMKMGSMMHKEMGDAAQEPEMTAAEGASTEENLAGLAQKVEEMKKETETKESEIATLKGQLASFVEASKKREVADHLEKVCKESGFPMSVTKQFRDLVGEPKSTQDIDSKFKLFSEGYKVKGGEAMIDLGDLMVAPEKATIGKGSDALSFADCVR